MGSDKQIQTPQIKVGIQATQPQGQWSLAAAPVPVSPVPVSPVSLNPRPRPTSLAEVELKPLTDSTRQDRAAGRELARLERSQARQQRREATHQRRLARREHRAARQQRQMAHRLAARQQRLVWRQALLERIANRQQQLLQDFQDLRQQVPLRRLRRSRGSGFGNWLGQIGRLYPFKPSRFAVSRRQLGIFGSLVGVLALLAAGMGLLLLKRRQQRADALIARPLAREFGTPELEELPLNKGFSGRKPGSH